MSILASYIWLEAKLIRTIIYLDRRSGSKTYSDTWLNVQATVIDLYDAQLVGSLPRFKIGVMLPNKKESGAEYDHKHIWRNSRKW